MCTWLSLLLYLIVVEQHMMGWVCEIGLKEEQDSIKCCVCMPFWESAYDDVGFKQYFPLFELWELWL